MNYLSDRVVQVRGGPAAGVGMSGEIAGLSEERLRKLAMQHRGHQSGTHLIQYDEDRQPTRTESRGQYRRREDQYLCIEIQPFYSM